MGSILLKYLILILGLFSLLSNEAVFSQESDSECLKSIKKYNSDFIELGKPKEGKVYFLDFEQKIDYWDKSIPQVLTRVKYYISADQTQMISNDLSVYMDKNYVFTVIESQKRIIVSKNPAADGEDSKSMLTDFTKNQKYIIDNSTVEECYKVKGKDIKKIVLAPKGVADLNLKIDKLIYYFDSKTGTLKNTVTTYHSDFSIRRLSMYYFDFQTNYNHSFPKDLVDVFLDKKGKLKPKYIGYELIAE